MDLLDSGTPGRGGPGLWGGARPAERAVGLAAAAVLATGVLAVATEPATDPRPVVAAAGAPTAAERAAAAAETRRQLRAGQAEARRQAAARLRASLPLGGPPYDRLPGRTPIPAPTPVDGPYDRVGGPLPPTGAAPSQDAAQRAVRLVLERYCHDPDDLRVLVVGLDGGWDEVGTAIRSPGGRSSTLQLRWTGTSYAWVGSANGVGCPDPGALESRRPAR